MDQTTMTPDRRLYGHRMYGRAADAFDAVAWKAPQARRFQDVAANDGYEMPSVMDELRAIPRWVVIATGGAFSALLGVLLGAALQI
jgi:hypothetical protein